MLRDFLKVKGKVKDAFKVEESSASNKNGGFKSKPKLDIGQLIGQETFFRN